MSGSRSTKNKQVVTYLKENDYANAVKLLIQTQINEWDKLEEGYKNLSSIKTKTFLYDGFKIKIQLNKERIYSTSAKVDADSIKNRGCFLCEKNLPEKQKGIKLLKNYLLLCNPYPVFPEHFTIVAADHKPQEISSSFRDFIKLAKLLLDNYTLIYNGPQCGASAPDHLHFQTGTKCFMPIEDDFYFIKKEFGDTIISREKLIITAIADGLRRFISVESTDEKILIKAFNNIYKELENTNGEPMMNLICNYDVEYGWRLIIFLRSKHRPSHYYLEGENGMIFSPAAIDLGGVCILPVENDFYKIDKELLISIVNEVIIGVNDFETLKVKLKKIFANYIH